MPYPFQVTAASSDTRARCGVLSTLHGPVETPVFMPVGTQGTVKAVLPRDLNAMGFRIILGNTYHLHLRPGEELIARAGGLHRFAGWGGSILTDSGGYQVFSLNQLAKISDEGVRFQSHLDGAPQFFTPESVIAIQEALGSDVMMPLDECPPVHAERDYMERSVARTLAWEDRALAARRRPELLLFGINQGGLDREIRGWHAAQLAQRPFDGISIGGLSVGEKNEEMYDMVGFLDGILPREAPRYLMGVGTPADLVECVSRGVDMFDCVLPTRTARIGTLFTWDGPIHIKNACFRDDLAPVEEGCPCEACRGFTRAYLRHLYQANEILASVLNTHHNLMFYARLVERMRAAIRQDRFAAFASEFLARYRTGS
jgi:queuine tRNA-ribosyltransferase